MKLSKKSIAIISAAIILVAGVVLAYLEISGVTNLIGTPRETVQEAQENLEKKKDAASNDNVPSNEGKPETTTDPDEYNPPTSSEGITLEVTQPNPQEVVVTTKLEGYSDGNCKLTASTSGKNTSQTAPVMFQREYSTCAGFTVPVSSIGTGTWNILLEVTSGDITTSKSTSLEVK